MKLSQFTSVNKIDISILRCICTGWVREIDRLIDRIIDRYT